jgi:D-beta-D-heptose 7-phosphate kinase/D-beta-D-heptose 1-phosphate adenosyltransferase
MLVAGDLMLDEFIWGKVSRISPEAPVPVVNVTGESYYPGGAANVARNLHEFTNSVAVIGAAGTDAYGDRLLDLMKSCGIDTGSVLRNQELPTTVKTRIIARNQQVVRVDRERRGALPRAQQEEAMRRLDDLVQSADGIIIADYGKGFLTQPLADHIMAEASRHGKVLTVDPHPHTSLLWHGATGIKPNRAEAFGAAGVPLSDAIAPVFEDGALMDVGRRLMQRWRPRYLLITLGEQGMILFAGDEPPYHIPTRAKEVFDVSGAGDTAIAVFTLGLCSGATAAEAAELANHASGIAVGKLGTATVTPAELRTDLARV